MSLQDDQTATNKALDVVSRNVLLIQKELQGQIHEPELLKAYILLAIILVIGVCMIVAITILRNSIVNFILRHQLRAAINQGFPPHDILLHPHIQPEGEGYAQL